MLDRDALQEYRRKRDFQRTSEPAGDAGERAGRGDVLSFVIQKHAARALHYDFRLELDGSLKSWAVPKGPSLDPHDKRMAVHVEDHPLAYASFEGVIPPGQYGAGTVIVWDRGEWRPIGDPREGMRAGKLKFELHGEKLHGRWTLVRMQGREPGRRSERQEPWLLIKERDDEARLASEFDVLEALPDSVMGGLDEAPATSEARGMRADDTLPPALAPQLATLVDRAPTDGDWLWELKLDGYRLLARIDSGNEVRLFTRMGHDWTARLKRLARMIAGLHIGPAWLDGEIVVPGPDGVPDFQALQNAFESAHAERIVYHLFDLPFLRGKDLRELGVRERRARLAPLLKDAPPALRFSAAFDIEPGQLLSEACRLRMEGLIGKRADAPYQSRRTTDWIKLKCTQRQEFVVVGYTDPKTGGRSGFGSLLLAIHDARGELRYVGNVGSGFDAASLRSVFEKMTALRQDGAPLPHVLAQGLPSGLRAASTHWIRPELVAEVSFAAWTQDRRLRHAVFHGLRGDKPAAAITREEAMPIATPAALPKSFRLTNPQRVIDTSTGATKLDVAMHYAAVAELMLPHLRGRPVALVRAPAGIGGELFFQKHGEDLGIPGLKQLDPELDPGHPPLLEVASARALLGAAQMNVIEFHTWNARARLIEKPDRMTFDLDPGEGVPWVEVREGARLVQTLLQELALDGWLKTSGGKGLHIVVPIRPQHDWDTVKALAQAIVRHLAATVPQRFVAKSGPKNRVGKIFVDYLRNGRGATTVAAWSARARPGLGVSVPVAWDELDGLTSGAHWTVATVGERLAIGNAPWDSMAAKTRQGLAAAMRALDFVAPD